MKPAVLALLSAVMASGQGTPLAVESRDVFVPPMTYPHAGTVWTVGQTHTVSWNTSNAPAHITNNVGTIMLRKDNYTTPVILQDKFPILMGSVKVKVPWVVNGTDYQLVLFGDSGNFSPYFTINN